MNIFPGPLKKGMNHAAGNQTDPLDGYTGQLTCRVVFENGKPTLIAVLDATKDTVIDLNAEIAKAVREATNFSKVNRVEVINHTQSPEYGGGRTVVKWAKKPLDVQISMQDDYRTLKLFVKFKEDGE